MTTRGGLALRVLLVDDERSIRLGMGDELRRNDCEVTLASDGQAALDQLERGAFDVVLSDIRLPRVGGLEVFAEVRRRCPETEVILMTAHGSVSDAVAAMKDGAFDYLTKPFDPDELLVRMERIAEARRVRRELERARAELGRVRDVPRLVGDSPAIQRLRSLVATVAPSEAGVLIVGESGTGKELVARSIHELSDRRSHRFVAVNCAALPETLIEAELFGHARGAFTGAVRQREGRFRAADGGTLLLDEVGELPRAAQAKLLRVLQEGAVEPLGTSRAVPVNVRVLSATHRNLKQLVADGAFREDLYYRLKVLEVAVPPLRDRREDLPRLVDHLLRGFIEPVPPVSAAVWAALARYNFPGNVRELEHALHHAAVLCRGDEIRLEHLPADLAPPDAPAPAPCGDRTLADAIREFEREVLRCTLQSCDGHRTEAARRLGISRKNLWEKLRAHGLAQDDE